MISIAEYIKKQHERGRLAKIVGRNIRDAHEIMRFYQPGAATHNFVGVP
jgi:hypothetical protein